MILEYSNHKVHATPLHMQVPAGRSSFNYHGGWAVLTIIVMMAGSCKFVAIATAALLAILLTPVIDMFAEFLLSVSLVLVKAAAVCAVFAGIVGLTSLCVLYTVRWLLKLQLAYF